MIAASASELIGRTPLVALDRIHRGPGRILAKAEFMQPGGSIKDRAALAILTAARSDGRLSPGGTVVEMTSGNMGAGLAVACAALRHPLVVTMSAGNSEARARMLAGLGAEVVLIPQVDGSEGRVTGSDIAVAADAARRIAIERRAFYVDQFHAFEPSRAHEAGTGREILSQAGCAIHGWVAAVGTGATFTGVARALKAASKDTWCAAVEPRGAAPLGGGLVHKPGHLLQGTGYGAIPPHWDPALMDESIEVSDDEATEWRHRLAAEEGLYVGFSAAANVCAASRLLNSGRLVRDAIVATVLCDSGLKY
jgi:cysteine synthase A